MTVLSLKTNGQSNLDFMHTQCLKMGGSQLGNKMVDIIFFFKICPLDPEKNPEVEADILNCVAVIGKSRK